MSANTRSGLKRKATKLAKHSGGTLDVRAYRTPDELAVFHPIARTVSDRPYQETLLGSGLPATPAFVRPMLAAPAPAALRAWLLSVDGLPSAFLFCPAAGATSPSHSL